MSYLYVPDSYEELIHCARPSVGLYAIVCIDNTTLGIACGGTRCYPYTTYADAELDTRRLAHAMTHKGAMLWPDYHVGGGKAVIMGDPATVKTPELLREYGAFIDSLAGKFLTGEDMGFYVADVEGMHSKYVFGKSVSHGGGGNPASMTALGCLYGMRAALQLYFGSRKFAPRFRPPLTLVFQGMGAVGYELAKLAHENGARLVVCDPDPEKVARAQREFGAEKAEPETIYETPGDIFVPCARGGVLNEATIPRLQCHIVAGSANNQFADPEKDSLLLHRRGIVHIPDYVINAGGLISITEEAEPGGYNETRAQRNTRKIYDRVFAILTISRDEDVPPQFVADAIVRYRVAHIAQHKTLCYDFDTLKLYL